MKLRYTELAPEHASIFGQTWWLDILCDKQWDVLVLEESGGTILWPYHYKKIGFLSYVSIPQVTLFQGPFVIGKPNLNLWNKAFDFFGGFSAFVTTHSGLVHPNKEFVHNGRITFGVSLKSSFEVLMPKRTE